MKLDRYHIAWICAFIAGFGMLELFQKMPFLAEWQLSRQSPLSTLLALLIWAITATTVFVSGAVLLSWMAKTDHRDV